MDPLIPANKQAHSNGPPVDGSSGFKPLSKASLSSVHASAESVNDGGKVNSPKVETVKVDGVVQSIQVTCSCGEVIVIDCQYTD